MTRWISLLILMLIVAFPTLAQETTGTTLDTLNLRSEPSFGNNVITQIAMDTPVTIQGRNSTGAWLFITANGNSGWVSPHYIAWDGIALSNIPVTATSASSSTSVQPASPPDLVITGNAIRATTKTRLNVRSEPNTSGTILTALALNQTVNAIGRNADGTWLAIDTGSVRGWVSAGYMILADSMDNLAVVDTASMDTVATVIQADTSTAVQTPHTNSGGYVITGADPNNSTSYDVEITLHWNTTANLDLRVKGPDGYWVVPGVPPSPTGGYFQQPVGANEDCNTSDGAALEVITWDKGTAPSGLYHIEAEYMNHCFADQEERTLFWVSVKNDGPEVEFWVYYIDPDDLFQFEFVRP